MISRYKLIGRFNPQVHRGGVRTLSCTYQITPKPLSSLSVETQIEASFPKCRSQLNCNPGLGAAPF